MVIAMSPRSGSRPLVSSPPSSVDPHQNSFPGISWISQYPAATLRADPIPYHGVWESWLCPLPERGGPRGQVWLAQFTPQTPIQGLGLTQPSILLHLWPTGACEGTGPAASPDILSYNIKCFEFSGHMFGLDHFCKCIGLVAEVTTLLGDPKDVLKLGEGKEKKKFPPFLGTPVSPLWRMAVYSPSNSGQAPCSHLSCLPQFVLYST